MVSGKEGKKGLYPDALEKYGLFFVHIYPEGLNVIYRLCFCFVCPCLTLEQPIETPGSNKHFEHCDMYFLPRVLLTIWKFSNRNSES